MKRIIKVFIIVALVSTLFSDEFEYSLEDFNPNSPSFGENVWFPDYSSYITLHYFGTQG